MQKYELILNKIAQGKIEFEAVVSWFNEFELELKLQILRVLYLCLSQCHPSKADIEKGIIESKLKPTYTPCLLIKNLALKSAGAKSLELPSQELNKIFLLWLSVFIIADNKRRVSECQNSCSHWWHNLS